MEDFEKSEAATNYTSDDMNEELRPSGDDPTYKVRIQEAEKLIETLNQKRFEVLQKIENRQLDRSAVIQKLRWLEFRQKAYRESLDSKNDRLEPLKVALDKLSFANKVYQVRGIRSCLDEEEINFRNLHLRLLHGSDSLSSEKKLIKDVTQNQERAAIRLSSSPEEKNYSEWRIHFLRHTYYGRDGEGRRRQALEELKQLKWGKENAIANAAINGKTWKSFGFGSKETVLKQIKAIENECQDVSNKHLSIKKKIKHVGEELEAIERDVNSLRKQLTLVNRRKGATYQCILKLKKRCDGVV